MNLPHNSILHFRPSPPRNGPPNAIASRRPLTAPLEQTNKQTNKRQQSIFFFILLHSFILSLMFQASVIRVPDQERNPRPHKAWTPGGNKKQKIQNKTIFQKPWQSNMQKSKKARILFRFVFWLPRRLEYCCVLYFCFFLEVFLMFAFLTSKTSYLVFLETLLLETLQKINTQAFAFSLPSSLYQSLDWKRNGFLLKGIGKEISDKSLIRKGRTELRKTLINPKSPTKAFEKEQEELRVVRAVLKQVGSRICLKRKSWHNEKKTLI